MSLSVVYIHWFSFSPFNFENIFCTRLHFISLSFFFEKYQVPNRHQATLNNECCVLNSLYKITTIRSLNHSCILSWEREKKNSISFHCYGMLANVVMLYQYVIFFFGNSMFFFNSFHIHMSLLNVFFFLLFFIIIFLSFTHTHTHSRIWNLEATIHFFISFFSYDSKKIKIHVNIILVTIFCFFFFPFYSFDSFQFYPCWYKQWWYDRYWMKINSNQPKQQRQQQQTGSIFYQD